MVSFGQKSTLQLSIIDLASKKPLVNVPIKITQSRSQMVSSDSLGSVSVEVNGNDEVEIEVSSGYFEFYKRTFYVKKGSTKNIIISLKSNNKVSLKEATITNKKKEKKILQEVSTVQINLENNQVNVTGNVENVLKFQALGVGGNNELSSSYSVRGGNFDENVVYVNGYEIYRPVLIRNAQQEGLSFANSDLIQNMKFSSGGFQARYGDKLSSVLDIEYKRPKKWAGSLEAGLMGGKGHVESSMFKGKLNWIAGARYRDNSYLLLSQDTKGQYTPRFLDIQSYLNYKITDELSIDWLFYRASNQFSLVPSDRETKFGLVNYSLTYKVLYSGAEKDVYDNSMNGFGVQYKPNDNIIFKWNTSLYSFDETQQFDIIGKYYIGEVESDINSSNFNNFKSILGYGTYQNWARDRFKGNMIHHALSSSMLLGIHSLKFGYIQKMEDLSMNLSEWDRLDSSGYSVPYVLPEGIAYGQNGIALPYSVKSNYNLKSVRSEFYIQDGFSFDFKNGSNLGFNLGLRINYWNINRESFISPRMQAYWMPNDKRNWSVNLSIGSYNQQPFLRELIAPDGSMVTNLKPQKSMHYILGTDMLLKLFRRPFKFTAEAYYKDLWDVNSYDYNNVLIHYRANNNSKAYAMGIDMRLQGEIAKNSESWITFSLMQSKETDGAFFNKYLDSLGTVYYNPAYASSPITDTISYQRGYVQRPNNQAFSFNLFYQDFLPMMPNFKVHLNLIFAAGLPFGPPNNAQFSNEFNLPTYKRIDVGFSALLYDISKKKNQGKSALKSIWATFEVFNVVDFQNSVSMTWVKDYADRQLAVPNYLTSRRINARIVFKF
jgi:hypothetical protein